MTDAPASSRAVRFDRYGDRSVLYVTDVATPTPASTEVLVHVRAAGINPGETNIRIGILHERFPATFPSGEGSDLAGVVTAVGSEVSEFAVGDEVLGFSWNRSSHATDVTVPASQLIHKPANLGWEIAGSLYVAGCTAFAAVRAVEAKVGETVAVAGASGGVGSIVVQLLKAKGANVLGISSARNADWLTTHGVIPVEYGPGLAERLRAAAPQGIDAFIDPFGPEYVQLAADLGVPRQRIETTISFQKAHELGAKQDGSVTPAGRSFSSPDRQRSTRSRASWEPCTPTLQSGLRPAPRAPVRQAATPAPEPRCIH